MSNRPAKTFLLLVVVVVAGIVLMNLLTGPSSFLDGPPRKQVDIATLIRDVQRGNVAKIEWQQHRVSGEYFGSPREKFETDYVSPTEAGAKPLLDAISQDPKPIEVNYLDPPASATVLNILGVIAFPLMLIAVIYFLVLRPAQLSRGSQMRNWGITDELQRLAELYRNGHLTDEEFAKAKADLLNLSYRPPA